MIFYEMGNYSYDEKGFLRIQRQSRELIIPLALCVAEGGGVRRRLRHRAPLVNPVSQSRVHPLCRRPSSVHGNKSGIDFAFVRRVLTTDAMSLPSLSAIRQTTMPQ